MAVPDTLTVEVRVNDLEALCLWADKAAGRTTLDMPRPVIAALDRLGDAACAIGRRWNLDNLEE